MYKIASYCELQHRDYALLRCECGECRYLDMSDAQEHTAERLQLKKSVLPLICGKCGTAHNDPEICLEYQGIRPGFVCEKPKTWLESFLDDWANFDPNDPNFYPANDD